MIVLDRISPPDRRIGWTTADTDLPGDVVVEDVERRLRALGISRHASFTSSAQAASHHAWSVSPTGLHYEASIDHGRLAPYDGSFYVAATLATVAWAPMDALRSVHLALYELLVNIHDHGRPIEGTTVGLRLAITAAGIAGALHDGCQEFSPDESAAVEIPARIDRRASRGYGLALVDRALDRASRSYGPTGNIVSFQKEFTS